MNTSPRSRLADVRFCVLDLETTGTSDETDEITEVGAVIVQGGVELGTFQTMVRHSLAHHDMTRPTVSAVLASLIEFCRGSVIVGHNVQFDLRFIRAALHRDERDSRDDALGVDEPIDTMPLARRLLNGDADDCRLGTLAARFSFRHRPTHRALDDALATVELLHLLIERSTYYGVVDLDDLRRLPSLLAHRESTRLALTSPLDRSPGVALLRDRSGAAWHVVRAEDLRGAVRALFAISSPVPAAVLARLHHLDVVQHQHPFVLDLVAARWGALVRVPTSAQATYLRLIPGRDGVRATLTTTPAARHVVAGPFPREVGARIVAALLRLGTPDDMSSDEAAAHLTVVSGAVASHEAGERLRSVRGDVRFGDVVVRLDDGRAVAVVVRGQACGAVLPPPPTAVAGQRPSAAHDAELRVLVRWLDETDSGTSRDQRP